MGTRVRRRGTKGESQQARVHRVHQNAANILNLSVASAPFGSSTEWRVALLAFNIASTINFVETLQIYRVEN